MAVHEGHRMSVQFEPGDRVRLNDLGISRCPKARVRKGVVVTSSGRRSSSTLGVLFDGNKRPTRVHKSYVELDDSEAKRE